MATATAADIGDALDFEITDWRETQRTALDKIVWPTIPSEPDIFKTAAMFNYGVDATKSLFPTSTAATLIEDASKKLAVPIWILGQAQTAFMTLHKNAVDSSNTKLTARFSELRDGFIRSIQTVARNFKNETYGRDLTKTIQTAVNGVEFKDDAQKDVLLRQFIRDANLIETDPAVLRQRTNDGFGRLCTKIRDLWRSSYHDAWAPDARMWYSKSRQTYIGRDGVERQDRNIVRRKEDQDWIIRNSWRMDVRYVTQPFNTRDSMDDCLVTLENKTGKPVKLERTYQGSKIDPAKLREAVTKLKQSVARQ